MKDKNATKRDDEDAVTSGKLAETIRESMRVFWEFVRADKEVNGNVFSKVSHRTRTHLKDPAISDLLTDIQTHLQKVRFFSRDYSNKNIFVLVDAMYKVGCSF